MFEIALEIPIDFSESKKCLKFGSYMWNREPSIRLKVKLNSRPSISKLRKNIIDFLAAFLIILMKLVTSRILESKAS